MEPREYCRLFEGYARKYQAGAFATPLAKDMEVALKEGRVQEWSQGSKLKYLGYEIRSKMTLNRKDFTGRNYQIPPGSRVLQHIANLDDGKVPNLKEYDWVYVYQEDRHLVDALRKQGFGRKAVRISASSEIIGVYTKEVDQLYPDYDEATLGEVKVQVPEKMRKAIVKEVESIQGWRDDYPYYNKDGSWAQVSLKGYKAEDPFWGVKPAEMSKSWKEEHPEEAMLKTAEWTVITKKTPAIMDLLHSVPWWNDFERVRLLQMESKTGGEGKLLRHTDITDRDAGTNDGQISRFHLPILSHPDARTYAWDLEGNMLEENLKPWRNYYLDQRKPHMVTVPAGVNRIHLVPDVISDAKVRAKIG